MGNIGEERAGFSPDFSRDTGENFGKGYLALTGGTRSNMLHWENLGLEGPGEKGEKRRRGMRVRVQDKEGSSFDKENRKTKKWGGEYKGERGRERTEKKRRN